jgi:hypothetical protein
MNSQPNYRLATTLYQLAPAWLRWSSIRCFCSSVVLLGLAIFAYGRRSDFSAAFVPALVVALTFAILLNVYSFWFLRREHQEADQAFQKPPLRQDIVLSVRERVSPVPIPSRKTAFPVAASSQSLARGSNVRFKISLVILSRREGYP